MNHQRIEDKSAVTFESFGTEKFLKISNFHLMRPFFMSVVSDSDHWMFISSNGGLSAGRKNADQALFPYYTDDKIAEFADITGSKSIFRIEDVDALIWEPFSSRNPSGLRSVRNIYKSIYGNKIIFEETLTDYQLTWRYSWSFSDRFGFVKTSTLLNQSGQERIITILDGIQNIMPYGVGSGLQQSSSNLVDAYKRSELHPESGLGIFSLSATIVDKAEPSECLKANIAWSVGLGDVTHLLSSIQLDRFRTGQQISEETDVKGEKGAYFINRTISLSAGSESTWQIIADVNKNHSQIVRTLLDIQSTRDLTRLIQEDIHRGTIQLKNLVASSDGFQYTNDALQDCRHFSNVLFNIMRGGIFDDGYRIDIRDFETYLGKANNYLYEKHKFLLTEIKEDIDYESLNQKVRQTGDPDLIRLTTEYLPLKFSRRHGDPSRPWNRFSINLRDENTGAKILDYEGNWRDIFQNWEALAYSYPDYIDGMLFKFLNSSTFDGYNPYRITKDGYDWEIIEPDHPWSYIGYWGDHQIIYLQKLLEIIDKYKPGQLQSYMDQDCFVYAGVPYIIKPYREIVSNPKDTILFDTVQDREIRKKREETGVDGTLLKNNDEEIYHVNLIEKLLAVLLSKLSNFIPQAGIWLNTQRPEWNDANNALVGNGVSMVTLYYLRRFLVFFKETLDKSNLENVKLSGELIELYHSIRETLSANHDLLHAQIDELNRKNILDALGLAASDYRAQIYKSGFWGKKRTASLTGLKQFVQITLDYLEHSIRNNQRPDGLFHSYNLMSYTDAGIGISHLDEMLEGQVAVLSSGALNGQQTLMVLEAMKKSHLYREDQSSYILYPNKQLPGFLQKNNIPAEAIERSELLRRLISDQEKSIVEKDLKGQFHFNGNFKNASDLTAALHNLQGSPYGDLADRESSYLHELFESVFNHKLFTGRSGTFFAYEGLGSIYWHMVSKLLLAVGESAIEAIERNENTEIIDGILKHFHEIKSGIGVHKSPALYGAFPTDPYSHTPLHRGAQQPGMTGQVKEDILSRWIELGVFVEAGKLAFRPGLLRRSEFPEVGRTVDYIDVRGHEKSMELKKDQLFFTYCMVPVIYEISTAGGIEVKYHDGSTHSISGASLPEKMSHSVFERTGEIDFIQVNIDISNLK